MLTIVGTRHNNERNCRKALIVCKEYCFLQEGTTERIVPSRAAPRQIREFLDLPFTTLICCTKRLAQAFGFELLII